MEWDQQQENQSQNQREDSVNLNVNNGVMYVKVMTDEQLETLRKQIAVYASICEQLVEMHKNLTAQQDLTGGRLGNLYCDPLMTSGGHKISARQRWTPTAVQLQILERIFDEGTGTPSKQKIKEITSELSQHGPISETNVYNWFQNRRARSKRKQVFDEIKRVLDLECLMPITMAIGVNTINVDDTIATFQTKSSKPQGTGGRTSIGRLK
ncbi:hypothetical protein GOBAR_AA31477 [Gossypium barbadense]|uniref:Homeobox domain-containing protein n=1 Tax=Gossypium barbadense TaxID=3634 RepID=A0A2P5WDQ7_GOSBA|nr:hypothetical protein GOBAR_AA31477 [Gossypium barbadense]